LNDPEWIFRPLGHGSYALQGKVLGARVSLFFLFWGHLELARWAAVAVLALVMSGWRPRLTGILHAWVAHSLAVSATLIDGGDQVSALLALLLVPVTLTDGRRWHWRNPQLRSNGRRASIRIAIAGSAISLIRLQVAVIYLVAGASKLAVAEWRNGTALYYWFTHPVFGAPEWLRPVVEPFVRQPVSVSFATWGVVFFEMFVASCILARPRLRIRLLPLAVLFHFAILLVHGLASFFFSMAGALVLYLWPLDVHLGLSDAARRLGDGLRRRIAGEESGSAAVGEPAERHG
jgi:antimicrobial peptide system SdpB family protein